jgi:hypothetical protein
MLALTHHFIVQYAAWLVRIRREEPKTRWFEAYAVLGDDIVIADEEVGNEYLRVMSGDLGVGINLSKSLVSLNGLTLEFAKRYYYKGHDCSPFSFKELKESQLNWNILVERQRKNALSTATILVAQGFIPKSLNTLTKKLEDLSPSLRRRLMVIKHPSRSSLT